MAALFGLASPAAHAVDDALILACLQITEPGQRLSCFDDLGARVRKGCDQACQDAAKSVPSAPIAVAKDKPPQRTAEVVDSSIEGQFAGWTPGSKLRLANGQVWEIADGSSGSYSLSNPTVRISPGVLGSYSIEIQGIRQTPRVRRVK